MIPIMILALIPSIISIATRDSKEPTGSIIACVFYFLYSLIIFVAGGWFFSILGIIAGIVNIKSVSK